MKEKFFNIRYIFGKDNVWHEIDKIIDEGGKGYIVVADGVVVNTAHRVAEYRQTLNESLFAMCDSGWIPVYLKKIYGLKREQYCGPQIFKDFIVRRKHRMFFMGTSKGTLDGLKHEMSMVNQDLLGMTFYELPYLNVDEFDYEGIARMVEEDGADIIWVALGAPKQCYFMQRLLPHLKHGVMLGVGAAFKFYSGTDEKRAPLWMRQMHLEFVYRIMQDPKKQLRRCGWIVRTLPSMISEERRKKRMADRVMEAMRGLVKAETLELRDSGARDLGKASRMALEVIYECEVSKCGAMLNAYWLPVVESVLMALEVTIDRNKKDEHLKQALKQYAQGLLDQLDSNAPECQDLFDKARGLGL